MSLALAFDIGGTNVRAGVVDREGALRAQIRQPLAERSINSVVHACTTLAAGLERDHGPFHAVGAGLAAMISSTGRVEVSPNLGWRDVDFATPLATALRQPRVSLLNDVDAICFGEVHAGAAHAATDVVCVILGTGVGSGFLLRGAPYSGSRGVGAELGHVKVVHNGRRCGCGARGCLEAYAGGRLWTERVREELARDPSLAPSLAKHPHDVELDAIDALAALDAPDSWASRMVQEVASHLGTAIANTLTLLNPSTLVVGGRVWEKCPTLRERTRAVIDATTNSVALVDLRIVDASLGDAAGLIGAGLFAFSR